MLKIFPLNHENSKYFNSINRKSFTSEMITVKVNKRGFTLEYLPFNKGSWIDAEPLHFAPKEYLIDRKDAICYIAFEDDKCVGQIVLVENWNNRALIWDIGVDLHYRRKGIGSALLSAARDWTKRNNLYGIMVEIPDKNPLACQFFDHHDFVVGGIDKRLYHSLKSQQNRSTRLRDTAIIFYNDFT